MIAMLALKRRRELRTDYRQRLALLKSRSPRIVIRRSLRGIRMQAVTYGEKGDKTLAEVTSSHLKKYGWKAHTGNMPTAYLTGLLFGKRALRSGIRECAIDIGLQKAVKGSSLFAAAKGCKDAGMELRIGEEILPSEERIKGLHIAEYAKKLKADPEKYRRQFSACVQNNLDPERLPEHFEEVRNKILQIVSSPE